MLYQLSYLGIGAKRNTAFYDTQSPKQRIRAENAENGGGLWASYWLSELRIVNTFSTFSAPMTTVAYNVKCS
jgi:hypothetical protein